MVNLLMGVKVYSSIYYKWEYDLYNIDKLGHTGQYPTSTTCF
jgi:hypothetical protein